MKRVIPFTLILISLLCIFGLYNYTYAEEDTITYAADKVLTPKFATSFGGTGTELPPVATRMSDGGYIVTGYFQNSMTVGDTTLTSNGDTDVFVVKYNSSNQVVSATSFGGSKSDNPSSIIGTNDGGYVVAGYFNNSMTVGGTTLTSNGYGDVFIVRYNSSNQVVSATSFGGTKADQVYAITATSDGGYIVTGYFNNSMTVGGTTLTSNGGADVFVVRYNSNNEVVSKASFGGTGSENTDAIIATNDGGYVVAGYFNNSMTVGDTTLTSNGSYDCFVVKYNSSNQVVSAISFGGSGSDGINEDELTSNNDYILTGYFKTSMTVGNTTLTSAGGTAAFILRINSNNEIVSATGFGNSGSNYGRSVVETSDGGYILAASYSGSIELAGQTLTSNGSQDALFIKFNSNNKIESVTNFGGTGTDYPVKIMNLSDGRYVTVGLFTNEMQVGNTTLTSNGSYDVFVTVLEEEELDKTLNFTKEDKDDNTKLKDAKFVLKKADIDKYYIDELTFGSKSNARVFESDANGNFDINFKVKGIYYLEEVESPDGYRKNDYSYIIEVKEDGIKVIEASSVEKGTYTNNLTTEEFTTKTSNLVDENKKDQYQVNYQDVSKDGYSIKKQAKWTDIENGKAKITIKIKRPALQEDEEELNTRVVYAFTTCTAHGFGYEIAKRNIEQLIKNYKTVDLIIANGSSVNDIVTRKNVTNAKEALNGIVFGANQHWGVNLYTGLTNYFKTTTPDVVYTSFDLLVSTKDGDSYTDESTWTKLKDYKERDRYYSLVGDFRYDEGVSNNLGWKTIAGLIDPNSWNGFNGSIDVNTLSEVPYSYDRDFRVLNIDTDPNSTKESVRESTFVDELADNLSITNVTITDNAPYKLLGNKVDVDLIDIDVDKEVTIEIEAELNEESTDSVWFNTNKDEATLKETRRIGRELKEEEIVSVASPKLAELGLTYDGEEITATNGKYIITNEKIKKHNIEIKKVDKETNEVLSNVEFTLRGTTDYGSEVEIRKTTNENGILTFDNIEEGQYRLSETKVKAGYENSIKDLKVVVGKEEVKIYGLQKENDMYVAKNYKTRKMVIKKVNEDKEVLEGALFKVYGYSVDGELIDREVATNEDGIIELEEGNYVVKEVKAPNGYALEANPYYLDEDNNVIEVTNNKVKGVITVTKKWSDEPNEDSVPEIVIVGLDKDKNEVYRNTTKVDDTKWVKEGKTWTYTFEISDLSLDYKAWEEKVKGYVSSNTDSNPLKVKLDKENVITNTLIKNNDIELEKEIKGNGSNKKDEFNFNIKIYNREDRIVNEAIKIIRNGKEEKIAQNEKGLDIKLKDGDKVILKDIETGYKYKILEEDTEYRENYEVYKNGKAIINKTKGNYVFGVVDDSLKVKFINEKNKKEGPNKKEEQNRKTDTRKIDNPNTADNISIYVYILLTSVLSGLSIRILFKENS